MDIVTIASVFVLGKWTKEFTIKAFIFGTLISGLGIALFGLSNSTIVSIACLAILYIGLAISQMANSFLLRMELPEQYRTQGLAFSVVPYYTADFVSGIAFATLIPYFSNDALLQGAGVTLMVVCLMYGIYSRRQLYTG